MRLSFPPIAKSPAGPLRTGGDDRAYGYLWAPSGPTSPTLMHSQRLLLLTPALEPGSARPPSSMSVEAVGSPSS